MIRRFFRKKNLSPVHISGFTSFFLFGLLMIVHRDLAVVPLASFILLCVIAPFLPAAGLFLPVFSRGRGIGRAVALTFDDGPDPAVTPLLLDLLQRYGVRATFFVIGSKAELHPELVREILRRGHIVGNHSYCHDPLLMLRSRKRLKNEISRTQELLSIFGIRPRIFRPPVGITNPGLQTVLTELRMDCVTFSCRGCDFGNRRIERLAVKILKGVRPGAIILLHDVPPPGKRHTIEDWLRQVSSIIQGLGSDGYRIVPLSDLIGRPVMECFPVQ